MIFGGNCKNCRVQKLAILGECWILLGWYIEIEINRERGNAKLTAALENICVYRKGARGISRGIVRGNVRGRGRGRGLSNPAVGQNQCAYCKKEGHWKRECPALLAKKKGGYR